MCFIYIYNYYYSPLSIWTSNLRRSRETAESFDQRFNIKSVRFLNEIYSGVYENMTMVKF